MIYSAFSPGYYSALPASSQIIDRVGALPDLPIMEKGEDKELGEPASQGIL